MALGVLHGNPRLWMNTDALLATIYDMAGDRSVESSGATGDQARVIHLIWEQAPSCSLYLSTKPPHTCSEANSTCRPPDCDPNLYTKGTAHTAHLLILVILAPSNDRSAIKEPLNKLHRFLSKGRV
jgi:hypothetical protein